jgi:hypothetical protein
LQIQLFVGFGWNKACRRPLYRLSYGMGISEIILVPLPKGLCVPRWARYPRIDAVRQSSTSNHLKERPAMRTDEIDLCDLHEEVALALDCRQGRGTAGMTLT